MRDIQFPVMFGYCILRIQGRKKKDRDIKDGVTIVMNHMDHMFDENFPFYIAVAFVIQL